MKKLNCESLMIGDWVLTLDSTHKEKVFAQVDAIEEGKHSILVTRECSNWFVDIDWIEPISLTQEILEKNGFVFVPVNKLYDVDKSLSILLESDGEYVYEKRSDCGFLVERADIYYSEKNKAWSLEHSFGKKADINTADIDYIHELQQALRLCGITREIIV